MNRKLVSKSNLVLRKVLNKEEHIDILKDMIEGILDIKIESIRLNPYLKSKEKKAIFSPKSTKVPLKTIYKKISKAQYTRTIYTEKREK